MNNDLADHFANLIIGGAIEEMLDQFGGSLGVVNGLEGLNNSEKACVANAIDRLVMKMKESESFVEEFEKTRKEC